MKHYNWRRLLERSRREREFTDHGEFEATPLLVRERCQLWQTQLSVLANGERERERERGRGGEGKRVMAYGKNAQSTH